MLTNPNIAHNTNSPLFCIYFLSDLLLLFLTLYFDSIFTEVSNWESPSVTMLALEIRAPLHWHHNGRDSVSNHQPHHCLFNRLFRRRSKKTSKLRVTGLCVGIHRGPGNSPQMASYAENVSIWWRHHGLAEHATDHHYLDEDYLIWLWGKCQRVAQKAHTGFSFTPASQCTSKYINSSIM